jgi:rhamnose utilization protein RhaD (predicted bifunctional aldolase and dehydrogenase)
MKVFLQKNIKKKINELTSFIGRNFLWTQGPGGNSSVKDNNILWVKSSGKLMKNAKKENIFTPLDQKKILKKFKQSLNKKNLEDLNLDNFVLGKKSKPSIEAIVHSIIPHKYVAHLHCLRTLSISVQISSKKKLISKLRGLPWKYISYHKPGYTLARAIFKKIDLNTKIYVLENHGIFISSDNPSEIKKILIEISKRINIKKFIKPKNNFKMLNIINSNKKFILPKNSKFHILAYNKNFFLNNRLKILFPDQVVFLGKNIPYINLSKENYFKIKNIDDSIQMIIFKDIGILINRKISLNSQYIIKCLYELCLRIDQKSRIRSIPEKEIIKLINWSAEKYRQRIFSCR